MFFLFIFAVFTARRYEYIMLVYAVVVLSVRPTVSPSQASIVAKRRQGCKVFQIQVFQICIWNMWDVFCIWNDFKCILYFVFKYKINCICVTEIHVNKFKYNCANFHDIYIHEHYTQISIWVHLSLIYVLKSHCNKLPTCQATVPGVQYYDTVICPRRTLLSFCSINRSAKRNRLPDKMFEIFLLLKLKANANIS